MNNLVGQTLERYQILALLGEGGMGAVFKAHDITLQRDVAIKVLHPQFARRSDFRERFLQEARTAARMNHSGIVQVHDFGQKQDILYIVMEFIPGNNLYTMLQELRSKGMWIRLDESVELVRQISLALDYAHDQGILHRDIKPGNIMLKPDPVEGLPFRPVITDLGLAKLLEGQSLTQEGTSMGTPAYMSPEQAMGKKTDARSDVYSLGILLYELAVGQLPFPIKSLTEAMRYHTTEPPPPPRTIRPDLPPLLEKTIMLALEKDPAHRPPDAGELAKGLKAVAATLGEIVNAPTALGEAVSLVTEYQASIINPRGASVLDDFEAPSDLTNDRIQVLVDGQTTHSMVIPTGGMTMGRDESCELVLNDRKASRKHVRLEYDGVTYRITDLNSSNGTFLGNSKLLPGVSEVWHPDKPLRIGDTWLRLVRVEGAQSAMSILRSDGSLVDPSRIRSSTGQGRVSVFVENPELQVDPGRSVNVTLIMLNQGSLVDHFRISIRGLPGAWTPSLPPPVQLMPGSQQSVILTIQPPRSPQTRAGDYNFAVRVVSQDAPGESVETSLSLKVGAFDGFSSEFHPQRLLDGKAARATIRNQGNRKATYRLSMRDRGEEVSFRPPQAVLEVEEGKSGFVEFSAAPRRKRWFGREQVYPFTLQVSDAMGETQSHAGELLGRPRLPAWLVPTFLILCLLAGGSAALAGYIGYSQNQVVANTTATARAFVATQVGLSMTETAAVEGTAQVAAAQASATVEAEATQAAATALAQGDDDKDGLSNAQEILLGTNPNNPDTDGDGLSDGDEVNRYGTNPLLRDSDGDNISDGDEVARGTNPLNPDTDGDGLWDNVDPDPLSHPTATPRPPPDGVSMNCDGTYQKFRFVDGGAESGRIAIVDLWNGSQWKELWRYTPGDPNLAQIELANAGFHEFMPCQTLLVIPVRYSGSGTILDIYVYYWTGSVIDLTLSLTGLTQGEWSLFDNIVNVDYAVYQFNEPLSSPCNRENATYVWNSGLFGFKESHTYPTYSGDPPAECTMAGSLSTLDIRLFRPAFLVTAAPIFMSPSP
jgi:eukaryotic-like serine/threonine-protein kinase